MRSGRFACVAPPIILTIAAIIAFLIATLSGVAHNRLSIFTIDLSKISIDPDTVGSILDNLDVDLPSRRDAIKITAADLDLADSYEVTLWGYCETTGDKRTCPKAKFNWAANELSKDKLDDFGSVDGVKIDLPEEIVTALDVFVTVNKYTEIAFIVALVILGLELFLGIFATCTRVMSCVTWLVGVAAIIVCTAASSLATAMAAVVVGAAEGSSDVYGAKGTINTNFLAVIWIGTALAIVASLLWLFTICCCKPDNGSSRHNKRGSTDGEKLMPSRAYFPVQSDHEAETGSYYNQYKASDAKDYTHSPSHQSGSRADVAYEPYAHQHV